jgi:phosphate transport system permease protein
MSSEQARVGTESATSSAESLAAGQPLDLTQRTRPGEVVIQGLLFFCGFVSIFTTLGIVYVLFSESLNFFFNPEVSLLEFLNPVRITEEGNLALAKWQPEGSTPFFSIWPLINATFMITIIALLVSVPLGIGAAIYLSEYASMRVRNIVKPILEILAGIPTVVYGFFAITFMTPLLQSVLGHGTVQIYNTASAGIVVGILILPMIASMSEDALSAVPRSLRQASYGLGATRFETATKVVLPGALSGVIAALIIATSRAVGETMIVAIAAGAGPNFTFNPFEAAETMTGHIARISGGDISYQTVQYNSLFAIGLTLFVITLTLNIISYHVVKRFREVYE